MGPVGEAIMEIAYEEYVKEHGEIKFEDWFDNVAMKDDDFDEKFRKARQIYSERENKKWSSKAKK